MSAPPPAQLTHLGLYVDDMDAMVGFYTELLGMVVTDSGEFLGRNLTFLSRNSAEHHQLVLVSGRQVEGDPQLLSQLSFRLNDNDLTSLRWFHRRALELGATGMEGRNHGNSWSIYFRDPEGNRLELYTATPWYVSQPWRVPLDLDESDQAIRESTQKLIQETGTWSPVQRWKAELAERLGEPDTPYRSIWTALREISFTQGRLDAGGVSTRFAEAGPKDAPALVMLHGTGGHWETFVSNIGPLSEHFRCVAFDMVGNGFSSKPDKDYEIPVYLDHVTAVMDELGIERASFLGVSLGSWVAARLALVAPERVDKLILLSPAGLIATASNMARIRAERTRAVEDPNWDSIKAMFNHLIADERNRIPDIVALRQAIYRLPETKDAIDHVLILQDADARARNLLSEEEWGAIQAPLMVVASGKDVNEYQNTARRVAALVEGAEVVEMPTTAHWPHFEDPEYFNEQALRFLLER
jgi:pimeloyl-ACP methyl ester carboxylesterase/catechol 2,3-dioxygenase-like lactoylglutathione lyase family enzyme